MKLQFPRGIVRSVAATMLATAFCTLSFGVSRASAQQVGTQQVGAQQAFAHPTGSRTTTSYTTTTTDAWGNRRTTTVEGPSSAAGYIAQSAIIGAPIVPPYSYGYPAPYPYYAPIQSGPLHPPALPNGTSPWITSIPLGTTYTSRCQPACRPACVHAAPQCPPGYYPTPTYGYPNYGYPTYGYPAYGYPNGGYYGTTQSSGVSLGYSNGGLSISLGSRTTTTR